MESSGREFACIGLPADNNSWRWSTDSSFTLAETLYLEKGLFLQTGVMSRVQRAGDKLNASPGFRKASLGSHQIYSCLFSSLFIKIRCFFFLCRCWTRAAFPSGVRWILELTDKSVAVVAPLTLDLHVSVTAGRNPTSSAPPTQGEKEAIVGMINGSNSCAALTKCLFGSAD